MSFELHPQLEADSLPLASWELSDLRLMNDNRFPWLILIPRRVGIREIFELSPEDQTTLFQEISETAVKLKRLTRADKINIAALGNQVPQLHIHIIARFETDAAWPKPVWGVGQAIPYLKLPEFIEHFISLAS